jgi:hypothetical protein
MRKLPFSMQIPHTEGENSTRQIIIIIIINMIAGRTFCPIRLWLGENL